MCKTSKASIVPGEARKTPKHCPGGVKMRPRGAKTGTRAGKKQQEKEKSAFLFFFRVQHAPRAPKSVPKGSPQCPRVPKRVPRGSEEGLQTAQKGAEEHLKKRTVILKKYI